MRRVHRSELVFERKCVTAQEDIDAMVEGLFGPEGF